MIKIYSIWWILNNKVVRLIKFFKILCSKSGIIIKLSKMILSITLKKNNSKWQNKLQSKNSKINFRIYINLQQKKITFANICINILFKKLNQRTKISSWVPKKPWKNKKNSFLRYLSNSKTTLKQNIQLKITWKKYKKEWNKTVYQFHTKASLNIT